MGRPKGSRSPGYEARRAALARKVFEAILVDGNPSLRAMAGHARVSRPTLRHYFGDREGAVRAALLSAADAGRPHLDMLLELPTHDARSCLRVALQLLVIGWRDHHVGHIHEVGLKVGLEDDDTGHTYRGEILDPLLATMQRLIQRVVDTGGLGPVDPRAGALMLLSPVVVGLLHQHGLGGASACPLDLDGLIDTVVDAFVRAHPPG